MKQSIKVYRVIGVMSGTSLDGVDVACCSFEKKRNTWQFSIEAARTFKYPRKWKQLLATAQLLSGEKLMELHSSYGTYLGELCNDFIRDHKLKQIDHIASHGHTIFHQPANGFTFQLGDGNNIHAATGLPVVFDFRSLDVALGGQGAPLVPMGDRHLFSKFDVCLNLGGIANLSMELNGVRKAFDVCYCNMALNYLTKKIGLEYDNGGKHASTATINKSLLKSIDKMYAATRKAKPSLGREGFEKDLQGLLDREEIDLNQRLRTICDSIVKEIALAIPSSKKKMNMLVTGGGAHNRFLIDLLRERLSKRVMVVVPDQTIIDFKEALVFAFLSVLRRRGEVNVLESVTGAQADSCSGVLVGN